jgi:hypothetical protein
MSSRSLPRRRVAAVLAIAAAIAAALSCRSATTGPQQTYAAPDDAVKALIDVARKGTLDDLMKILGPRAQPLVDASDPQTARQNREVFVVAAAEQWRLVDNGPDSRLLIVGHESWPFPVPLVKNADRWRFDTAAGVEEVMARRIGRNELAAIRACRTYVFAQRLYASRGHDGKPAGLYATALGSDPGRHNGLYWPARRGEKRSPLGDLIAASAREDKSPFHGYRFKILTSPEPKGFALVAWPATYDSTGVMTFVVSQDGIVREKDLGPDTARTASAMAAYGADQTWATVQ